MNKKEFYNIIENRLKELYPNNKMRIIEKYNHLELIHNIYDSDKLLDDFYDILDEFGYKYSNEAGYNPVVVYDFLGDILYKEIEDVLTIKYNNKFKILDRGFCLIVLHDNKNSDNNFETEVKNILKSMLNNKTDNIHLKYKDSDKIDELMFKDSGLEEYYED